MGKSNYYSNLKKFYLGENFRHPNGFGALPLMLYMAFCAQINKGGKILDLGCGNGLLLKYLMETSGYKLIPYGIDFIKPSIEQARKILHPKYENNFLVGNVIDYPFENGPFDFIITFISHIHEADRAKYLEKLKKHCKNGGKVIFYEYADALEHERHSWVGEFKELKNWRLTRKDYPGLSLAIWNSN